MKELGQRVLLETTSLRDKFNWSTDRVWEEIQAIAARHADMIGYTVEDIKVLWPHNKVDGETVYRFEIWGREAPQEPQPGFNQIESSLMYKHIEDYKDMISKGVSETDALKIFWMKANNGNSDDAKKIAELTEKGEELCYAVGVQMMEVYELKKALKNISNLREYLEAKPHKALDALDIADRALGIKRD